MKKNRNMVGDEPKTLSPDQSIRLKCLEIAVAASERLSGGARTDQVLDKASRFEQYVVRGDTLRNVYEDDPAIPEVDIRRGS